MPTFIRPPRHAPYLEGIAQLEDALLSKLDEQKRPSAATMAEADRVIASLRKLIRQVRQNFEARHDVIIEPEKPVGIATFEELRREAAEDAGLADGAE